MNKAYLLIPFITTLLLCAEPSFCTEQQLDAILSMSMEELMAIDVSIATKTNKPLSTTAAPVFVINADDIRRSGAANIPEALRMAPGLQVSQINGHDWAVTIRGFNDVLANKVLVLVDGRSVYGSFHSGTHWRDLQGLPLENIERIEIIRGPGSTIWGANAVNGVINIITRSALSSKGEHLVAGGGTAQRGFGRFDTTQKITDNASVRGYGSYFNVAPARNLEGSDSNAGYGWYSGARFDWDDKQNDNVMVDASWYENTLENSLRVTTTTPPYTQWLNSQPNNHQGGHFLTRWQHRINNDNYWAMRGYYDHLQCNDAVLNIRTDSFDVDFSHYVTLNAQHNITWGAGYRRVNDYIGNTPMLRFNPRFGHIDVYNIFAQDDITLDNTGNWHLTLGSKLEYYSLTRFEVEPSASLSWRITDQHTLWASVSHAVRTPARSQVDVSALIFHSFLADGTTVMAQGKGKRGIDAENETAYQIGWRGAFSKDITADVTAFYASYNDLTRLEYAGNISYDTRGFAVAPIKIDNNLSAQSYGTELSLSWQATEWWRNYLSYSFFKLTAQAYANHALLYPSADETTAPQQQVSLRNNFNINSDIDFDLWWRYTDAIEVNKRAIHDYFTVDLRLAWRPVKQLELSLIGQNLIQTQHIEYQEDFLAPQTNSVSRGVYAKINWQF